MKVGRYQLGMQDSVGLHVEELVPLLDVLAQPTFVTHSQFLHDPTRGGIVAEVVRMDAVEAEFAKGVSQHGVSRFCAVAAAPIRFADPITQFGVFLREVEGQADGPDEFAAVLPYNGKYNLPTSFEAFLMGPDPLLGHAVFVRVGDVLRRRRDGTVTREELHARRVTQIEWTQDQPFGFKCGTALWKCCLQGAPLLRG